jgi:hypothetical protein
MAKKPGRGRGRGKGSLTGTIGKGNLPISPVTVSGAQSVVFADDSDSRFVVDEKDVSSQSIAFADAEIIADSVPVEDVVEEIIANHDVDDSVHDHQEIEVECLSMGSAEDDCHPTVKVDTPMVLPCTKGSDWKGLFKSNSPLGNLQYFAPQKVGDKIVVSPPPEAVEEGISKWKSSLIGQFLDKPLPFFLVKKSIDIMWKQYGNVEVFSLKNGLFIFRFPDEVTRDEVLDAKLSHISNKPLILRKWMPGMQVMKLTLATIPVWIKLLHLPMEFWTQTCLSHVASGVGKPLYADKVTEEQKRLGYARVLVEIDVNSECPKEIDIELNGESIVIGVEYPWLPPKCSLCAGFGHSAYACS